MLSEYVGYIARVASSLIQSGADLPDTLLEDIETYEDAIRVEDMLVDVIYLYRVASAFGARHLKGFMFEHTYYDEWVRNAANINFNANRERYEALVGKELLSKGISNVSTILEEAKKGYVDEDDEDDEEDSEVDEVEEVVEDSASLGSKIEEKYAKTPVYIPNVPENGNRTKETSLYGVPYRTESAQSVEYVSSGFMLDDDESDYTPSGVKKADTDIEYTQSGSFLDDDDEDEGIEYVESSSSWDDEEEDEGDGFEYVETSESSSDEDEEDDGFEYVETADGYSQDEEDEDDDGFEYVEEGQQTYVDDDGFEYVETPEGYSENEDEDDDGFEYVEEPEGYSEDEDDDGFEYVETDDSVKYDENGFEIVEDDEGWSDSEEDEEDSTKYDENGFEIVDDDGSYTDDDEEYAPKPTKPVVASSERTITSRPANTGGQYNGNPSKGLEDTLQDGVNNVLTSIKRSLLRGKRRMLDNGDDKK